MTGYSFERWAVDAPLTGAAVDRSGRYAAFSGGDGAVRIVALDTAAPNLSVWRLTRGAVLALTADCGEGAFLCGTDEGAVFRVDAEDGPQPLTEPARSWPDQLVTHPCGGRAIADGPMVRRLDGEGRPSGILGPHPSTIAGLAFDDAGRQLAVSHYNGVTIWQLDGPRQAHSLFHRGSHLELSWRRDGRYVVTATQDKTVHAWDLRTGDDASLGQCFNKVRALGWSADGQWLLASGNDTVSAWPFANDEDDADDGDLGDDHLPASAPRMLGRFSEQFVSRVSPHPALPLVAAGYHDGGLELISLAAPAARRPLTKPLTESLTEALNGPLSGALTGPSTEPSTESPAEMPAHPVVALGWSPDGDHLIGGDQNRRVFVCRFDSEWLADLAGLTGAE